MGHHIIYASTDSPLGPVWVAAGERGVVRLGVDVTGGAFARELLQDGHFPVHAPDEMPELTRQLDEYFAGERRCFDVELDLGRLTVFQQRVLRAVATVPYGEVRSYRDIAELVGKPLAARAVGGAVAINPISIMIPCHRIVKSDYSVGYYATQIQRDRGVPRKLQLLALEGLEPGKGIAK